MCMKVAKAIRTKQNRKYDYEIGEILVCRKYKQISKSIKLNVNYKYKIVSVSLNAAQQQTHLNIVECFNEDKEHVIIQVDIETIKKGFYIFVLYNWS